MGAWSKRYEIDRFEVFNILERTLSCETTIMRKVELSATGRSSGISWSGAVSLYRECTQNNYIEFHPTT